MIMKFKRRVCDHPAVLDITTLIIKCPDLYELETGDFVAIGKDVTDEVIDSLPADTSISKGEKAIKIPRKIMISAIKNIAENQR